MGFTIRDVAKLAGVNASTVSRVINRKASVTEETRERIFSAMKQLNYHPNSVARNLASGCSATIGLVLDAEDESAYRNPFFQSSQHAIVQAAQEQGYDVLIVNGGRHALHAAEGLALEKKVDGLIVPPSAASPALHDSLGAFPHVFLGQPNQEMPAGCWVDVDNLQGAQTAVVHLLDRGYRKIAYLGGTPNAGMGFIHRRLTGYRNAIDGLHAPIVLATDGTPQSAKKAALTALHMSDRPDAFLCDDNLSAFGLLQAAEEAGLRVPMDVGAVTFNNYPLAEYTTPALSAMDVDTYLLGAETARMLFDQIQGLPTAAHRLIPVRLIARASSAHANDGGNA